MKVYFLFKYLFVVYFLELWSSSLSTASGALATLSLKDGITVERRVDDESDKKKEYVYILLSFFCCCLNFPSGYFSNRIAFFFPRFLFYILKLFETLDISSPSIKLLHQRIPQRVLFQAGGSS
jgi:hypothetical protein